MNKYDMSEFLVEFTECCVPAEGHHEHLEPLAVKKVQIALKKFAMQYKKDILELFAFSEGNGKYAFVYTQNLVAMMDAYEEYHDDMVRFITSLQNIHNERVDNLDQFLVLMKQAEDADQNFLDKTLLVPEVKMVFPEALANVELMVRLVTFIDEVSDNFIRLSAVNEETNSERIRQTLAFYQHSTEAFTTSLATKFFELMSKLIALKDGRKDVTPVKGEFKLI